MSMCVLIRLLFALSYQTALQWWDGELFPWQFFFFFFLLSRFVIIEYFNILLKFSPYFILSTMMCLLLLS